MPRFIFNSLIMLLVFPCLLLSSAIRPVYAEMIATAEAIALEAPETSRARVAAFIERQDVQQILIRQGVDDIEAQNRLQALSDMEIMAIARHIDNLPAGGNGFGSVVGAILVIFIVLLITDLLGLTHVFPFVNR